ncbi:MAG: hypothetical protein R3D33_08065 [Hyphomicrobiaceae bacterium]
MDLNSLKTVDRRFLRLVRVAVFASLVTAGALLVVALMSSAHAHGTTVMFSPF